MRKSLATLVLLVLAPVAGAQQRDVSGTLARNPLRIAVALGRDVTLTGPTSVVRVLDTQAAEGLNVRMRIAPGAGGATILSIQGRTVADTRLRYGPSADSDVLAPVRAHEPVTIVEASDGAVACLQVEVGGRRGWLPVSVVAVGVDDLAGAFAGKVLAPAFEAGSEARKARFFHPDGHTYTGTVVAVPGADAPMAAVGQRLVGSVLVRLGGGIWRLDGNGVEPDHLPDALSLAIRFRAAGAPLSTETGPGDEDLLVSSWAERFGDFLNGRALLECDPHDFGKNTYFPAMPFKAEGVDGQVWVRIRPLPMSSRGSNRIERLDNAIADGGGRFRIELQRRSPVKEALTHDLGRWFPERYTTAIVAPWIPVAEMRLEKRVDLDQSKLHYHPGMAGRGLTPTGFIMSVRNAVYRSSQDGRARTEPTRDPNVGIVDRVR